MKTITPCPSPRGTNNEKLFLFKMPRSPLGALDAAKRQDAAKRHGDEDTPSFGKLRVELDEMLARSLSEAELEEARALLDQHLGPAEEYDRAHDEDDDEDEGSEPEGKGRSRMRQFLAERGASDDDIDELFTRMDRDEMPHNGGGGRVSEREAREVRGASDRQRRMAADHRAAERSFDRAAESFDRMFPDAARIKMGL